VGSGRALRWSAPLRFSPRKPVAPVTRAVGMAAAILRARARPRCTAVQASRRGTMRAVAPWILAAFLARQREVLTRVICEANVQLG
jgi:hypothetical protein